MVPGFEVLIFWVKCCLYVSGHDTRTVIAGIQETSPDGNIHFGSNAAYMFPDMILEPLLRASKRPRSIRLVTRIPLVSSTFLFVPVN
jgi:hypothetical protein